MEGLGGNLVNVDGRMNSSRYQQRVLDRNVGESVTKLKLRQGWNFQQDKDPKHCSKSTKEFMQGPQGQCCGMAMTVPDLDIIENVWIHLKQVVCAQKPRNLTELEAFCMEEWPKVPPARLQGLVSDYRRRLQAVIAAEGGSTKY